MMQLDKQNRLLYTGRDFWLFFGIDSSVRFVLYFA